MAATTLNPILAGLTIAGAAAAAQSTIAAMILAVSGIIVKNIIERVKPDATPRQLRFSAVAATFVTGIATFIMALDPPPQLEWIVMFAIGGLASAFFWPMLLGLYWPRMNQWGALASMLVGVAIYMTGKYFYKPLAMGLDPIVIGLGSGLIAAIAVSFATKPTDMRTLQIFWGAEPVSEEKN
jgi:sodium/pantothenate symporter